MSTPSVTMEELELERAELLPNRETLCSGGQYHSAGYTFVQNGYGNTAQSGFLNVSAFNGSFINIASIGSGTVL
jgi:hypothetical protein